MEPLKLIHTRRCLEVNDADLSHLTITDADTTGMTINGVLVSDLQAAYRATLK